MILIFGGAYQGKLEFAGSLPGCSEATVFHCEASADGAVVPDLTADIIYGLDRFAWACCCADLDRRVEAADWMRDRREEWQDKILIMTDVSQGIVPIDARTRAFREMNGRLMLYLASEAEEVWRVFCGIGKRIK